MGFSVRPLVKLVLKTILGDYEIYSIYCRDGSAVDVADPAVRPADKEQLLRSEVPEFRALANYDGAEARCFVLEEDQTILCVCWYWYGEQYRTKRGFWPLLADDAKLVQITTLPAARGRGLARRLIAGSAGILTEAGFTRLYARVWRGHRASEKAFEAAGWRRIAWVVGAQAFGRPRRLTLNLAQKPTVGLKGVTVGRALDRPGAVHRT